MTGGVETIYPDLRGEVRPHFIDYLSTHSLPVNGASVRRVESTNLTMALIDHAPNAGVWFDPIDDIVISVVVRSTHSEVVRDVGFGKVDFRYAPGHILLTPPYRGSYWRFDGNPTVLHLSVPRDRLLDLLGEDFPDLDRAISLAARLPVIDPLVSQLAQRMWSAAQGPESFPRAFLEKGLGAILSLLLSGPMLGEHSLPQTRRTPTTLAQWRLKKALKEIAARKHRISVNDLAEAVELSPDYFVRAFKATTGYSPYQMASNLRIEEAKRLLCQTRRSMTDIALELGFSSSAHFSSRFKQLTGMSPTDWRATYSA